MSTVNLPAATGSGKEYTIMNSTAGIITVDGDGAETIGGNATIDLYADESISVVDYDTGKWVIV